MSVATLPAYAPLNGAFAAPGTIIQNFGGVAIPLHTYLVLEWVIYAGQIGDTIELWLRPALASAAELSYTLAALAAAATPTNLLRGCVPVPIDPTTRIPWVLGATKAGAGNANVIYAYRSSEDGSR